MIFNFYTITAFINFLSSVAFAIFVFSKNRKSQKNIGFCVFAVLVGFWSLGYFFWQNSMGTPNNEAGGLFWARTLMIFATLIPAGYLHFAIAATESMQQKKKLLIFAYVLFFFFMLSDFTPFFINKVAPVAGFPYWPQATPLFSVYLFCFLTAVVYSSYLLVKKYRASNGVAKLQMKYLIIGYVIAFVSGCTNFPAWYGIPLPPVINFLVPAYIVLTAYAITRYKLMDIKIIARNIFLYFNIALSAYVFFYLVAYFLKIVFGDVFAIEGYLLGLFIAPVFALVMYGGSNFLSSFINRHMFSSFYKQQNIVKKAIKDFSQHSDLEAIGDITINAIDEALEPDGIGVLFAGIGPGPKTFETIRSADFDSHALSRLDYQQFATYFNRHRQTIIRDEIDQLLYEEKEGPEKKALLSIQQVMTRHRMLICMPLMISNALYGIIVIGITEKSSYSQEDLYLLETISHQAEIAIENSTHYRQVEQRNVALMKVLDKKDAFINLASRQLRPPLAVLANAHALAEEKVINEKESVKYWGYGLQKLSQTVESFWHAFRASKPLDVNFQPVDILEILKKTIEEKQEMISLLKKDIKIVLEKTASPMPMAWCDPKQIGIVIHNLLDNAILYTQKGTVTVGLESVKDDGLHIVVADTGIGLSKEDMANMGKEFYRGKEAKHHNMDGSGLGLYISKKILEANYGNLAFISQGQNQGSLFTIELRKAE